MWWWIIFLQKWLNAQTAWRRVMSGFLGCDPVFSVHSCSLFIFHMFYFLCVRLCSAVFSSSVSPSNRTHVLLALKASTLECTLFMLSKHWQKAVEDRRAMMLSWISLLRSSTNIRIIYTNDNVSSVILLPNLVLSVVLS